MSDELHDRSLGREWVVSLMRGLAQVVDVEAVCHSVGIDASELLLPQGRVDATLVISVLEQAAAVTRDPLLGLHLAERSAPRGIVPVVVEMQETPRQAIEVLCRCQHILRAGRSLLIVPRGRSIKIIAVTPSSVQASRYLTEYLFAAVCHLLRRLVDYPTRFGEVRFRHPAAGSHEEYERVLDRQTRFDQQEDALILPASVLDRSTTAAAPAIMACLRHTLALCADLAEGTSFRHQVGLVVRSNVLAGAECDLASIAEHLALEPATVQRKLSSEQTTHAHIVASVRRELAERLSCSPAARYRELVMRRSDAGEGAGTGRPVR